MKFVHSFFTLTTIQGLMSLFFPFSKLHFPLNSSKHFSALAPPCSSCNDYHRFCPALHDAGFAARYQELLKAGTLEDVVNKRAVPEPINCENDFYKISCPKSCNICKFNMLVVMKKFYFRVTTEFKPWNLDLVGEIVAVFCIKNEATR